MITAPISSRRQETAVGVVILLTLAGIAFWVLRTQSRFDPAILTPVAIKDGSLAVTKEASPQGQALQNALGQGMRALTDLESFGPETLSEKIDGKAELYLAAGFQQMHCQRFVQSDDASSWMEVFVYDMGDLRNAFSVYSSQRRADAREDSFTQFAYHSQNALFFVHGQLYVEIVASSANMLGEMLEYGRRFVGKSTAPSGGEVVAEMALFPTEGLEKGSMTLLSSDVFGFDGLDRVFIASYKLDGVPVTAFISRRKNEQEAAALASAYRAFLLQNGGQDVGDAGSIEDLKVISIMDSHELVFTHGPYVAGVHEADRLGPALRLVNELNRSLQGAAP